jgi:hypothetical protein
MSDAASTSTETAASPSSDYFERVPLWGADGPGKQFEIMADELSGRIPVTRLESWRATSSTGLVCNWYFAAIVASTGA